MASVIKWKKHPGNLASVCRDIYQGQSGRTFTDAVVVCGTRQFQCHQAILSASSEFFDLILRGHPGHIEPVIVVEDVDQTFMEAILNYLYTGIITIDAMKAQSFLQVCSYFKIKGLMTYDVFRRDDHQDEEEPATITPLPQPQDVASHPVTLEMGMEELYDDTAERDDLLVFLKDQAQDQSTPVVKLHESGGIVDLEVFADEPAAQHSTGTEPEELVTDVEILQHEEQRKEEDYTEYFPEHRDVSPAATARRGSRQKGGHKAQTPQAAGGGGGKKRRSNEGYTEAQLAESMDSVCNGQLNLSTASQRYNVPKSVLWRKLQKRSDYVAHPPDKRREAAKKAVLSGESMLRVSKKFNVPLATLYRDKLKLVHDGRLGSGKRTKKDAEDALRQAVMACDGGMAQSEAARKFNISKSTLWRKMRKA